MKRQLQAIALAFLILLLPAGCKTTTKEYKYNQLCKSWLGAHSDDLIRSWGPPTGEVELSDGCKLLTWKSNDVVAYSASGCCLTPLTPTLHPMTGSCQTTFEIGPDNRVKGYKWEGNYCLAEEREKSE